ncbi:ribonuclease H-like domain-containing protein [Tanacetum coccineum]
MHQPSGFQDSVHPDYVCLLHRSLYGLKQGMDAAYLLLYVDDIVLTASESLLQQIIRTLHQQFSMTDLGSLNYFLGISVICDSTRMFLSQRKYAVEILEKAHMVGCNPSRTPIDTQSKLRYDGDPVSNPTLYRTLAGYLQYLTFTRLDISYAVQHVCLHMHDPWEPNFLALKQILRYVRGDRHLVIVYFLATTFSPGPLSVNRRFLALVSNPSIGVLPMLLLRPVGYGIYFVSYILLYLSLRLSTV